MIEFDLKKAQMFLHIICSSTLQTNDVKENGLKFSGFDLCPFLKIHAILASFQEDGKVPASSDC